MKKETLIAMFFGISLGLVLGIFVITKNKETQINKNKAIAPTNITEKKVVNKTVSPVTLEITSVQDKDIVDKSTITISGKAEKGSLIVIESPIKDVTFKTDSQNFSQDFPLALGENQIDITAYSPNKNVLSQEKLMKIYYFDSQL